MSGKTVEVKELAQELKVDSSRIRQMMKFLQIQSTGVGNAGQTQVLHVEDAEAIRHYKHRPKHSGYTSLQDQQRRLKITLEDVEKLLQQLNLAPQELSPGYLYLTLEEALQLREQHYLNLIEQLGD